MTNKKVDRQMKKITSDGNMGNAKRTHWMGKLKDME